MFHQSLLAIGRGKPGTDVLAVPLLGKSSFSQQIFVDDYQNSDSLFQASGYNGVNKKGQTKTTSKFSMARVDDIYVSVIIYIFMAYFYSVCMYLCVYTYIYQYICIYLCVSYIHTRLKVSHFLNFKILSPANLPFWLKFTHHGIDFFD